MIEGSLVPKVKLCCLALCLSATSAVAQTAQTQPSPFQPGTRSFAPLAPPPGQVNRYTLPIWYSVVGTTSRSFTAITIRNNSSVTCNAGVRFRTGGDNPSDICVISHAIAPRSLWTYCSRPIGTTGEVFTCEISCPNAGLTSNGGSAYITSDNTINCETISVDARLFYTTNSTDTLIASQSNLTVVKANAPNKGD